MGATLLVTGHNTYQQFWVENLPPLKPTQVHLQTYMGKAIKVQGEIEVEVNHNKQTK